jgi:HEAT repeat protein
MKSPNEISMGQVIDALLDEDTPLKPRYLYRFSDLTGEDLSQLKQAWLRIPLWRRQALMEDVGELGESDDMLSFEALARFALLDTDPKIRLLAVHALWDYEQRDLALIFLGMLKTETSIELRAALASALGRFVYLGDIEELDADVLREIEDYLLEILRGTDNSLVQRCALESLGYSRREEVIPLIEQAYNSQDKDWVGSALFAMGCSADEAWAGQVLNSLNHVIPTIRTEAARAAGALDLAEAADTLKEMLNDDNEQARMAAIWSLSQVGGEGVHTILEELLENEKDEDDIDFLEAALDNMCFTEEMQSFPILNVIPDDLTGRDDDSDLIDEIDEDETLDDEDAVQ